NGWRAKTPRSTLSIAGAMLRTEILPLPQRAHILTGLRVDGEDRAENMLDCGNTGSSFRRLG
ncbi:hypothetical protein, partial [Dokdonella sp.]|uniref:hypothetical protein n=1 Tax=Dokdonella sp. TaxID=2291710 RepID=UPI003C6F46C3